MKTKNIVIIVLVVALGVLGVFLATRLIPSTYTYQGSMIEPAVPAYQFELVQSDGEIFRLADQHGKVVLLYFGYTNCPDVCPTTLSDIKKAYVSLGEQANQVIVVFITVDPERDTPEKMETYMKAFHEGFVGLSGTEEDLQPIWDAFYVVRSKVESDSALKYLMEHSARVMVVDKQGNFRMTFPFGMASESIADDVVHLLEE